MSENRRTYTDEEFALVLKRAAELARESDGSPSPAAELSLDDMKAIAAEVGFDPELIERAAYTVTSQSGGSLLRWRRLSASFPIPLTQDRTAHVLSAIKANTKWNVGEATESGLFWGVGGLSVTMHNEGRESRAQVSWNPSLAMIPAGILGLFAIMLVVVNGNDSFGTFIGSITAGLGVALGTWATFAKRAKKRVAALMDTISRAMATMGQSSEESSDPALHDEGQTGAEPDRDAI